MAEPQEVRRLYNAKIGSDSIAYAVFPDLAVAITLTCKALAWNYGAWAQIVATVGAADVWLVSVGMENPSDPTATYQIQIGTGALAAEVGRAAVPYQAGMVFLPYAMRVLAATRLAGRAASSSGVADTVDVKVGYIAGV